MSQTFRVDALAEGPAATDVKADWLYALVILAFAALMRLAFFRGALGTDEIVYMTRAHQLLAAIPDTATYIGSLRYGINAFQALSFRIFGYGVVGADGLFFVCSLAEVLLAYGFAYHLWGRRAAIWSALALAVVPIDVAAAGSLNPDCYLALVIDLSIVVFYCAAKDDRTTLFFFAGLLAGWVFWIKEAVIVFAIVFLFFAMSERRWRNGWFWFALGCILCLIGHLVLFWILYGNAFYVFGVLHRTVNDSFVAVEIADTSLWTYFTLLFVKIYHTGLLGWLALAGCFLALLQRSELGTRFVAIWALGLVLIFSAFPISFSPLKFIAKQSNYMEIFVMPLALLAGWCLAQQRRGIALLLGVAMVASGILLSALEQQVVRVVAVNGRSAAGFARAHPGVPVFGPLTAQRQSALLRLLGGSLDSSGDIRPWAELSRVSLIGGSPSDVVAYLIEDPQMQNWPDATAETPVPDSMHRCLLPAGALDREDLGLGRSVLATLRSLFAALPTPLGAAALRAADPLWQVAPAQVYAITRECAHDAQGRPAS